MTLQKINTRNVVLAIIIVLMAAIRLLNVKYQVYSNLTPVGALAVFSGVYFDDKWKAYAIILLTFFVSDIFINHFYFGTWSLWNSSTFWYGICFSIIVFFGSLIKKINVTTGLVILLAPVAIHWLIMDLPWIIGIYPKTFAGYSASLVAAIPFEKNMLFGDAIYGLILFGGFELAKSKYTSLRNTNRLAV